MPMSSEEPGPEQNNEVTPPSPDEGPPAPGVEEPVIAPPEEVPLGEEYEELIEPEEPAKPRKKRKHVGAIIFVVIIIIILLTWTLLSPKIMPVQGTTYVDSATYANLASFNGTRDTWAGTTTWGISVSGPTSAAVNQTISIMVLITKISEDPGNFWFRGTAITVTNVTVLDSEGTILATMGNRSDLGFGKAGTVRLSFPHAGDHTLKVTAQFLVYVDMRIGYLPVEKINIEPLELEPIHIG